MVPLEEGNFVRIMEISMAQDGGIGPMEWSPLGMIHFKLIQTRMLAHHGLDLRAWFVHNVAAEVNISSISCDNWQHYYQSEK